VVCLRQHAASWTVYVRRRMLAKHPGMFFATQSDFRNVVLARFFFLIEHFLSFSL